MGTLLKAATGFAIALTLLHGTGFWSGLKSAPFVRIQADIAAMHPGARLEASLNGLLAPQKDTATTPGAVKLWARGLQF